MGFTEIARDDRTVDRGDDLGQGDRFGRAREHVTATHATFGADESHALQTQQNLLQIGLGQSRALGEVAYRRRRREIVA
jgi:hypothetical protein